MIIDGACMTQDNVVWVLGAGFSKPLGGPLLRDLLGPSSIEEMRSRFPKEIYRSPWAEGHERLALDAALWSFGYGTEFRSGHHWPSEGDTERGETLWDEAEDFLDHLDLAAGPFEATWLSSRFTPGDRAAQLPGAARRQLARVLFRFLDRPEVQARFGDMATAAASSPPELIALIQRMNQEARRMMVAQCSAFMYESSDETERWAPFKKWGASLSPKHTVITFNYDCAAERAAGDKLGVALQPAASQDGKARLYKLHGSTDWVRVQNGGKSCQLTRQHEWGGLNLDSARICIGTPGPGKREVSSYLQPLWDEAMKAIRHAEAIIFVGYRFPPSDSDAREKILEAIQANESPRLLLHTVLGPDVHAESTSRLRGLLLSRLNGREPMKLYDRNDLNEPDRRSGADGRWYAVLSHPLYSQDFVSAPGDLFRVRFPSQLQ
ncbi:MAG: SIR2 family protein [Deltaproteobacteria bacterium]